MKGKLLKRMCVVALSAITLGGVGITGTVPFVDTAVTASAASVYGDFEYTVTNGKATLTKYKGSSTSVSVPASINGYPVTEIGEMAFNSWSGGSPNLTSVTIPNSVKSIGNSAFAHSGLTSVTIPGSVTSIGGAAFYECKKLTSVTISNGVKSIGREAFSCCTKLTSVNIPESVNVIGVRAFNSTGFSTYNQKFFVIDNWLLSYNGASTAYVTIPDSVKHISEKVFSGLSQLTSVNIPGSVTSIGSEAFAHCKNLTSVYIPDSVTRIDKNAFLNCPAFSEDSQGFLTSNDGYLLGYVGTDSMITIPNNVTRIGAWAFKGLTEITSVTIPDSVTSIGGKAFYNCTNLNSVNIPDSVSRIEKDAFTGCPAFSEDSQGLLIIDGCLFGYNGTASTVIIPKSVTRIMACAFKYNTILTSVTIPDSVTSIGAQAFMHCSSLTSISIPDSVTKIEHRTFHNCRSLTSVSIPDSVTSIGAGAFYDCEALTSVTIPNSVTSIGDYAFMFCSGLTSVTLLNGVESIGAGAFQDCVALTSVTIPDSVTSIGEEAFDSCGSLTSITIPDSVTSIGAGAFRYCSGLTSITIPGSVKNIGTDTFYGCSNVTSVTLLSGVESIGSHAFARLTSLEKIVIPKTVKTIDQYALSSANRSLVVRCDPKSYACTWARTNGWQYEDNTGEPLVNYASIAKDVYAPNEMFVVTCDAEAGTAPYLYSLYYRRAGTSAWTVAQGYTEQTKLPITLTEPGYYELRVNVADDAGEIARKEFTVKIADTLSLEAAIDTQMIRYSNPVNITCGSAGGLGEHQYAVYTQKTGDTDWTMLSDYSAETSYVFTPETEGTYAVRVDVKDEDNVVTSKEMSFTVVGDSSVTASVSVDFIRLGDTVELTYAAKGGFNQYEYTVSVKRNGEDEWIQLSDYSIDKKLSFTPEKSGVYTFRVEAKDADGVVVSNEEASFEVGQNLTNTSVLGAERIILGSKVKVRCFAEGGSGDYQYAVYYKKSSAKVWTKASAYSKKNIVVLAPQAAVSYDVRVDIKDTEGTVVSKQLKLTVAKELANTSKLGADTIKLGEKVKVRCFATGGMGDYEYAVYYKKSTSEKWSVLRNYGTNNILMLTPKAAVPYDVRVDVKDAAGKVASKTLSLIVTE